MLRQVKISSSRDSGEMFRRRKYASPPIVEAVCELRFEKGDWDPTTPGKFHQRIEENYPAKPREVRFFETQMSAGTPLEASVAVKELPNRTQFSSDDGRRVISIGPRVLNVSELKVYSSWKEFKKRIKSSLEIYEKIASVSDPIRIGIRYINRVVISAEDPIDLHKYFTCAPQDLSEIPHRHLPSSLAAVLSRQEYVFDDGVRLARVFANAKAPVGSIGILLDLDVYWERSNSTKNKESADVMALIEKLRVRERVAFEASITDASRRIFNK